MGKKTLLLIFKNYYSDKKNLGKAKNFYKGVNTKLNYCKVFLIYHNNNINKNY